MAAHVSALLFAVGPLAIYLMKRDQSKFVADHAREALNFQLTVGIFWLLLLLCIVPLVVVLTFGLGAVLLLPAIFVYIIAAIVLPLQGARRANRGQTYSYPFSVRWIGA